MPLAKLYISEKEVARMMGHNEAWLSQNAPMLEKSAAFPPIDPVIRLRHRESIENWARDRNAQITNRSYSKPEKRNEENIDAF